MDTWDILIYIASLIVGYIFNFLAEPDDKISVKLAKASLWMALFLSAIVWINSYAGIKNEIATKTLSTILNLVRIFSHLLLGYLLGYISRGLKSAYPKSDSSQLGRIVLLTLLGVSIVTCNSFILATVGKATNMANMKSFFTASGYAVWFLYFIMVAEALGALGVLLHFKLKTGPWAVMGLMLIMLGAIYTQWHDHNPLSDSVAAISQFITLSLMLVLYYFEKQANRKQPATPIYVV